MPWARAPKAPWVEVWLSPQTMVMPGRVKPCSGPTMWTMPWRWSSSLKYSTPKSLAFLASASTCDARFRIVDAVAAVGGRHVVVDDGERLLRRAHLAVREAQALEGLRAGHLVDEMAVDVEEAGAVGAFLDQMVVPDLVVERLGDGHFLVGPAFGFVGKRPTAVEGRRRRCDRLAARPKGVDRHVSGEEPPGKPRAIIEHDQLQPAGKCGNARFHRAIDSKWRRAGQRRRAFRIQAQAACHA